jgi:osmoprotectant transport system substrate-binding protein
MSTLMTRAHLLALIAAAGTSGVAGCAHRDTIRVGSKSFTEELVLGELYAQSLEHAGFAVSRQFDLGTTDIAMAALRRGAIDLYPEYTGTALLNVLHLPPDADAQRSYATVKRLYAQQFDLVWLAPAPLNDTQALATTSAVAAKYGLRTLSDLAPKASQLRLGTVPEFLTRADGLPGLQQRYGGFRFKATRVIDNGLKYDALEHGDVDIVVAFSTEGQLKADALVVLRDDRHLFPAYHAAPVVRASVLATKPGIADALNRTSSLLTDSVMQDCNLAVDGPKKREPFDVAREVLAKNGLS